MDNRHHLVVDCRVTLTDGYGERNAPQQMVAPLTGAHPGTMGADKGYDPKEFLQFMDWRGVTSHVAQNINRVQECIIDQHSRRHQSYEQSLNA